MESDALSLPCSWRRQNLGITHKSILLEKETGSGDVGDAPKTAP